MKKPKTLDEFKDKVYSDVRMLELLEKNYPEDFQDRRRNGGCLGMLLSMMFGGVYNYGRSKYRKDRDVEKLDARADAILAREDVKTAFCEVLDESVRLPIDIAGVITPILYEMSEKDPEAIPRKTLLFALIAKKIASRGTGNYCK